MLLAQVLMEEVLMKANRIVIFCECYLELHLFSWCRVLRDFTHQKWWQCFEDLFNKRNNPRLFPFNTSSEGPKNIILRKAISVHNFIFSVVLTQKKIQVEKV